MNYFQQQINLLMQILNAQLLQLLTENIALLSNLLRWYSSRRWWGTGYIDYILQQNLIQRKNRMEVFGIGVQMLYDTSDAFILPEGTYEAIKKVNIEILKCAERSCDLVFLKFKKLLGIVKNNALRPQIYLSLIKIQIQDLFVFHRTP
jgi:hypothetical protein